ncbi:hypothetical protein [Mucilaginibacter sp. PAMB04168]|uniref:hypothetical protein n=1 Tax=Mucilaginibacter sp. PAMB04168 TaxID=3138567 RepID=UPI0031F66FE3
MYTINRKIISSLIAAIVILSACTHDQAKSNKDVAKSNAPASPAINTTYGEVNTWLDDFKNFRTAVYQKDLVKMKSYFDFSAPADTTQIWTAIYDNRNENKRPETYPSTFTEADLEKYHRNIFTDDFTKSLLKVKSEVLYRKGEYTTPGIKQNDRTYHMLAQYDKATTTLQLFVSYSGGVDENGEEVSEGEYAIIYFFKIENGKYLKFDKILFAG